MLCRRWTDDVALSNLKISIHTVSSNYEDNHFNRKYLLRATSKDLSVVTLTF
jgi:hypothetical protein